ncbi:MAG TPA: PEP-CTERM sorting domain-containing protein [Burkholderiales bacterium]|nr:PEP-CTERM sorting domain-containing protein [Burkholderiales bacterium]
MKHSRSVAFVRGLRAFFFSALLAPTASYADVISHEEFGATFWVYPALSSSFSSYDANTDVFTSTNPFTGGPRGTQIFSLPIVGLDLPLVDDLRGTFSLTAIVNETGFFGGSYSWIGGSASLGIAPGTEILSGKLTSFEYFESVFQGVSSIDVIDSSFAAFVGPVNRLLIEEYNTFHDWGHGSEFAPFSTSVTLHQSWTTSPSLFLAAATIPEPQIYALILTGLGMLGFVNRRKWKLQEGVTSK